MAITITTDIKQVSAVFDKAILAGSISANGGEAAIAIKVGGVFYPVRIPPDPSLVRTFEIDLAPYMASIMQSGYIPIPGQILSNIALTGNNATIDFPKMFEEFEPNITPVYPSGDGTPTEILFKRIAKVSNQSYQAKWQTASSFYLTLPTDEINIFRYAYPNQIIPVQGFADTERNIRYALLSSTGSLVSTKNLTFENFGLNFFNAAIDLGISAKDFPSGQTLLFGNDTEGDVDESEQHLEVRFVDICYPRAKVLYWITSTGAWDWYLFTDYDKRSVGTKQHFTKYKGIGSDYEMYTQTGNQREIYSLKGMRLTGDYVKHIEEIVSSPVVVDESGNRVRVLTDSIEIDGPGFFEPEIEIEYLEKKTIRYV